IDPPRARPLECTLPVPQSAPHRGQALIIVAYLLPLAVYCLVLGFINRRRHPLMVAGAWDFAGLLFAASGFLAFGLPGLLSGFTERGRSAALFGRPASGGGAWAWLAD